MDISSVERLYRNSALKAERISLKNKRYIYNKINWDNRLISIRGSRGVGKTTLLLQRLREAFGSSEAALYVSLDNMWFQENSLIDLAEYHVMNGGTHLFLDEIHYLPHWSRVLKNLYDDCPELHIVYTGSCMLEMVSHEGDLSRRQVNYTLHGLSFREFLCFEGFEMTEPCSLEDITGGRRIDMETVEKLNGRKILPLFSKYLQYGYYPFYKSSGKEYFQRLEETVKQVIENDLPAVEDVTYSTVVKVKRMLMLLAQCVPQTPKMSQLYATLETNRDLGLKMLYALERANLLALLTYEPKSLRLIQKPDKFYLGDTNLMYALVNNVNTGTVRETFFYNQLQATHEIHLARQGDFIVDGTYTFEVGGRTKDFSQIKDIPGSYVAADETEYKVFNKIPLWLFGMMY